MIVSHFEVIRISVISGLNQVVCVLFIANKMGVSLTQCRPEPSCIKLLLIITFVYNRPLVQASGISHQDTTKWNHTRFFLGWTGFIAKSFF